jgi:hypothetical protein
VFLPDGHNPAEFKLLREALPLKLSGTRSGSENLQAESESSVDVCNTDVAVVWEQTGKRYPAGVIRIE